MATQEEIYNQDGGAQAPTDHAADWVAYARSARRSMRWDREVGIWPANLPLTKSPGWHQANTGMRTARAIRLEQQTSLPHCVCCLKPMSKEHPYWMRGKK